MSFNCLIPLNSISYFPFKIHSPNYWSNLLLPFIPKMLDGSFKFALPFIFTRSSAVWLHITPLALKFLLITIFSGAEVGGQFLIFATTDDFYPHLLLLVKHCSLLVSLPCHFHSRISPIFLLPKPVLSGFLVLLFAFHKLTQHTAHRALFTFTALLSIRQPEYIKAPVPHSLTL